MSNHEFKTLIIAGGFGTRLGELGYTLPKGLIPYGNTTIIGNVTDNLHQAGIKEAALITNSKYCQQYENWSKSSPIPLQIINNGVHEPHQRLGALGDIQYAVQHLQWQNKNILVVPSDTFFEFPLTPFISQFLLNPNDFCTIVRKMDLEQIAGRLGCATLDDQNRIIKFTEKPENPLSPYASIPFYYYAAKNIKLLDQYQQEGNSMDAPGSVIPWFISQGVLVYAHVVDHSTIDVGTMPDVQKLQSQTVVNNVRNN